MCGLAFARLVGYSNFVEQNRLQFAVSPLNQGFLPISVVNVNIIPVIIPIVGVTVVGYPA